MSEVLDPPVVHPLTAALDLIDAALDEVGDAELWGLSGPELLDTVERLHRLGCRGDAQLHRLVREVDARGAATDAGAPSTAAWLRERCRLHPGAAKRLVVTARAVHDDPGGVLVHHADPGESADSADAANAPDAAEAAGAVPGLSGAGRPVLAAAFAAGEISGEHVAVATAALGALPAAVDAATVARAEAYLAGQARVQHPKTLGHLARHLRHAVDPDGADTLAGEEEAERAARTLSVLQRANGGSDVRGHLDPELTAALLSQLLPLAAPRRAVDGVKDLRTAGQRNADALADLLRIVAGADGMPTRHGSRPTVTITMALETLQRRIGSSGAFLDWAGPISAETARRIACDARVIPVVLGANGEPLDVGRASYEVTTAIWRALVARDGGCSFGACDRPPEWTEAHHRQHWEDGGETSVENCALFCDHHHRVVHHHGWTVQLIHGAIHVIPPPWIDPTQTPRPNIKRADLPDLATVTRLALDPPPRLE